MIQIRDERDLTWSLEPSGVAGPVPLRSPEPCGIVRSSSRHRAGLRKTDYVQKFRAATACRLAVASTHYTPPRRRASVNLSVGASVTLYVCGSVALCVCASVPLSVCPSLSWRTYLKTSLQVRLTLRRVAPLTRPPRGPRCRFGRACRMQAHAGGNGPVQGSPDLRAAPASSLIAALYSVRDPGSILTTGAYLHRVCIFSPFPWELQFPPTLPKPFMFVG